MGMNDTPSGERIHIGFFGMRNAGKSSVVNAVTGQDLAVVSDTAGTTTDPVSKAMELLPLGPVMITDTPGFDDVGDLGELRVRKTKQVLNRTDIAVLIVDGTRGMQAADRQMTGLFREKNIPFLVVYNKSDLLSSADDIPGYHDNPDAPEKNCVIVSAEQGKNIEKLKERMAEIRPVNEGKMQIVADLLHPEDFVVLVVPIDKAAPKGRLILPQQQTIRDILEADAAAIVVKEYELRYTLEHLGKKPRMVITDSQVFAKVSADVPEDIPLTSFSILMARYKGFLEMAVRGVSAVERIKDGDTVLIAEGCTHHRQCDDIGTVKIPRWLRNYTGKDFNMETCSGRSFPDDLSKYAMVIHCGGCMLNEREMVYRMKCAEDQHVPVTNYGTLIAYMQGILKRSLEPFPYLKNLIETAEKQQF
ncbi:MAG: [FeFe] hydrogenase H-cluster maturation GTPase HydF [Anaerovoracaceae bacterium]|nr:[FeFe] hydrogenase H-cluster maturation GTPase HydF [Bacillota bacterium]MDY2671262.1 [FeFe] hydrogenase H-cluster maturation GTPase HydF [Anaerovoracaceae bacterium]